MHQRFAILSVLFLAVIVSGCVGGGGGEGTESQGNQAINVNELTVTPKDIFADGNVRVRMTLTNVGQLPAELLVNTESDNEGGQILTNHCPDIFSVKSFSASSSNVSQTRDSYMLSPDYKVRLNWNLKQDSGNVPLNGYRCNLRFEVPFNYSVEAFKQVQVKDNADVTGSENLFAKSSEGPMKLEIETIGSSAPRGAPTFLKNDSGEVLIQLANKEPEEGSYLGNIALSPPNVTARGINLNGSCPVDEDLSGGGSIELYQDQSKVFRCDMLWENHNFNTVPSIRGEIFANADYTFVKTAGTKTVQVKYRGN